MLTIDIKDIRTESNVRNEVGDVSGLAASIDRFGMIQPIRVTRTEDGSSEPENYVLVAGARRLAAVDLLGWPQVEAILDDTEFDHGGMIAIQYAENAQRKDLTDWETAQVAWDLKLEGLKQDEVATSMGVAKGDVSKLHKIVKTLTKDDTLDDATAARFDLDGLLELSESPIPEHTQDVMQLIVDGERWVHSAIRKVEAEYATVAFYEENGEQLNEWTEAGVQMTHALPRHHWNKSNDYGPKDDPKVTTLDNLGITVAKHIKLECHMVYINDKFGVPNFEHYCMDRKTHADKGASKVKAKHQDVAGVPLNGSDPKAAAERKAVKDAKDLRRRQAAKWMSTRINKTEQYELTLFMALANDSWKEEHIRAATWMLGLNDERPKGADYGWYQKRLKSWLIENIDADYESQKVREWKVRMMHARRWIDDFWPVDAIKVQLGAIEVPDEAKE
jgi:ParB/RepB/Spo0J family partition protein